MELRITSIVTVGFVMLILFCRQIISFEIKTHLNSNITNENSNNDTLIFAHVVSETVKNRRIFKRII